MGYFQPKGQQRLLCSWLRDSERGLLMQEPLLIAIPPSSNQNLDNEPLSVFRLPHGILYPRWLALSALFDILLCCLGYIFWYFVPCPSDTLSFLSIFCEVYSQRFIEQCLLSW